MITAGHEAETAILYFSISEYRLVSANTNLTFPSFLV